jgi:hypothetical protein
LIADSNKQEQEIIMKYIVKEFVAADGHPWPRATVLSCARAARVESVISRQHRLAARDGEQLIGFRVYDERYRAEELAAAVNADSAAKFAEWQLLIRGSSCNAQQSAVL